ncbi:hypothetical protein BpHYR1_025571 [Brachionus plicatilis]|uniref:Uncharacterized protein n=1 Tax=Brachionus plicatilis TaxID=10195 RepID=A0A3M7PJ26_BRAPC|nr:hypothetical protein BpHYR1_025571 [Brachionus plicatilis]
MSEKNKSDIYLTVFYLGFLRIVTFKHLWIVSKRAPFLFLLKSKSKSTHNTIKNRERVLPRVKSTTTSKFKIEKTESLWLRNSSSNQLTSLASSEIWLRQGLMSGNK